MSANWQESFKALVKAIPPPQQPKYGGKVVGLGEKVAKLPEDFCALVEAYGSGEFSNDERGCIAELNNPLESRCRERADETHKIISQYRDSEGKPELPIYPAHPGLLLWGWSDEREHYFWNTVGAPDTWSTIVFADMSDSYEFSMPMTVFLKRLLFGEIHRRDLGYDAPDYDPATITFVPTFRE